MIAYVDPILILSKKDQKLYILDFLDGLILIINSVIRINIGTITNSFFPSDINFVKKLANKKYPNKIEIKLKDFNLQEELIKPNKKLFD